MTSKAFPVLTSGNALPVAGGRTERKRKGRYGGGAARRRGGTGDSAPALSQGPYLSAKPGGNELRLRAGGGASRGGRERRRLVPDRAPSRPSAADLRAGGYSDPAPRPLVPARHAPCPPACPEARPLPPLQVDPPRGPRRGPNLCRHRRHRLCCVPSSEKDRPRTRTPIDF